MTTRFVILAAPRTGSNWLCTLLDSHPQILCHHELFNPRGIHIARSQQDSGFSLGNLLIQKNAPLDLLRATWDQSLGCSVVGFKLNLGQSPAVFDAVLDNPEILKIIITRKNKLRTLVSEKIATTTGEWESYAGSDWHHRHCSVTVTLEELQAHVERNQDYYEKIRRHLRSSGQVALEVEYELLGEDNEQRRILDFLNVNAAVKLEGATARMNVEPLDAVISNYAELERRLSETDLTIISADKRYSGEAYWDDYHDIGLSRDLDRTIKQEKWLQCFLPVLQQQRVKTVLDLGCGSGYDALALAQLGYQVSGNDISSIAIDHAREQAESAGLTIDYQAHDIATSMAYVEGQFDAVICNLTLHMFPPEIAVVIVNQVSRFLTPGGLFMFHVNSTDDLPYRSKLQPPVVSLGKEFYSFGKGQTMRFFSEQACRILMADWSILLLEPVQMLRPDGQVQKCAWRCVARRSKG